MSNANVLEGGGAAAKAVLEEAARGVLEKVALGGAAVVGLAFGGGGPNESQQQARATGDIEGGVAPQPRPPSVPAPPSAVSVAASVGARLVDQGPADGLPQVGIGGNPPSQAWGEDRHGDDDGGSFGSRDDDDGSLGSRDDLDSRDNDDLDSRDSFDDGSEGSDSFGVESSLSSLSYFSDDDPDDPEAIRGHTVSASMRSANRRLSTGSSGSGSSCGHRSRRRNGGGRRRRGGVGHGRPRRGSSDGSSIAGSSVVSFASSLTSISSVSSAGVKKAFEESLEQALVAAQDAEEANAERRRLADEYLDVALYIYDQLCGRLHAELARAMEKIKPSGTAVRAPATLNTGGGAS